MRRQTARKMSNAGTQHPVLDKDIDMRIHDLFGVSKFLFQFFRDGAGRETAGLDGAAERVAECSVFLNADDLAEFRDAEDLDREDIPRLEGGGLPVVGVP